MHRIAIILLPALAAIAATKPSAKDVDQVLEGYREAPAIQAKLKKTVEQQTMGTEVKSEGDFYFSKGKLRVDIREPEKTTLVYDGKIFWLESRADEEHVVVTKVPGDNLRKSDSILAALFDKRDVLKSFNLKKTANEGKDAVYSFEAKDKNKSDVISLEIALQDKNIHRIVYKDHIDNRVSLEFSDLKKGSVSSDKFSYKPPKGAEVTEP
jgi:outer membrane lipoprotein-sorting protein